MLIKKVMLIWLLFKLWNIIFKNIEIAILLNCSYQQPQAIIFAEHYARTIKVLCLFLLDYSFVYFLKITVPFI